VDSTGYRLKGRKSDSLVRSTEVCRGRTDSLMAVHNVWRVVWVISLRVVAEVIVALSRKRRVSSWCNANIFVT